MTAIIDIINGLLILTGSVFILISSFGLVRLPDIYLRMSATTKAATLGVGSILFGTALYFEEIGILTRSVITIIFLLLTAPIGAHLIGRAAYFDGIPLWEKSVVNEFEGKLKPVENVLYSQQHSSEDKGSSPRDESAEN